MHFHSTTMKALDQDWLSINQSIRTTKELRLMIQASELLAGYKPRQIIHIIGDTKGSDMEEKDLILMGLFSFVETSELASRLILHSLKPQITYLIRITDFADVEERASTIFSIAFERIMSWRPKVYNFCHLGLYRSIHRTTMSVARKWNDWEAILHKSNNEKLEPVMVESLVKWVSDLANVNTETAEIVVFTRCGYSSVRQISEVLGKCPATLRQRRSRAEKQFKEALENMGYI